jgi:hypothetical protein
VYVYKTFYLLTLYCPLPQGEVSAVRGKGQTYIITMPPSTLSTCPVINEA